MGKTFKVWQQWLEPRSEEVERAIYIDFEGFVDKVPSFIGVQIEGDFKQVVFDEALRLAAEAKGLEVADFTAYMQALVAQAQKEARLIVAYSEHEQNIIREYAGIDISSRYLDARKLAKLWKNKCHHEAKLGMGLKDFLVFIDYERPSYLGEQKSTKRIQAVSSMLAAKNRFDALTTTVKGQWTKVLQHNRIDVQGMRALVLQAGDELSKWNTDDYILEKRIRVIKGDITTLEVDAIVNAANCSLMGGGGVDGAIHRAAGPEMPLACLKLKGCDVGEAKITEGFKLPAKYVIHTVGPTYGEGGSYKIRKRKHPMHTRLLMQTYRNCLRLATESRFRAVAFPAISTGAFGYPIEEATPLALIAVTHGLKWVDHPRHVLLVAYSDDDFEIIKSAVEKRRDDLRQKVVAHDFSYVVDPNSLDAIEGPIVRFAGREAEAELQTEGHSVGMGFCHVLWKRQKAILNERYGINWKTPAERNPGSKFD